ncbi:MAG: flagellar export chaperone FlgN [Pseudomonadota bacterium]
MPTQHVAVVFKLWLDERLELLRQQLNTAEAFKDSLIALDIEQVTDNIEKQNRFVQQAALWGQECAEYWSQLGFVSKDSSGAGLTTWLESQSTQWESNVEVNALLVSWAQFKTLLLKLQDINKLNQSLLGHLAEDNRRKLQALVSFSGIDDTVYKENGANEMGATHNVSSANPLGTGRLLAKG